MGTPWEDCSPPRGRPGERQSLPPELGDDVRSGGRPRMRSRGDEPPRQLPFSQWVRLHPSMPYFVYSPMVKEPFSIEPGKPYVSKFRYLTFDGQPNLKMIEKAWKDWIRKR